MGNLSAAALYAAFAAALLALAHRWIVRLTWPAALALLLLPFCFTGRALLTGQVYAPIDLTYSGEPFAPYAAHYGIAGERKGILTDVYSANIPWREAVRYALRQGEWPLWNPFILCGDPLAGAAQPAPYYPLNLLSLLLPAALAFTFGAAAQLFAAALAAFLYLRDLGCREVAALTGAVGWAFCSFGAFWLEWPMGAAVSLAPLVLLATRRLVRRPGWPSSLFLVLALVLCLLAGHPESTLHVIALGAILGVAEAAVLPPRRWAALAGWTLAAGGLALAVTAAYLLPVLEVLQQTVQWLLRQGSDAFRTAAPAAEACRLLAAGALPSISGLPRAEELAPLGPPLASGYAGSALWGPALYGLVRGRWRGRHVLAAAGLGGLCMGAKMPWLYPLLGRLPLFSTAVNERLVFAGALAVAALAALGVEAWLRRADEGEPAAASRELAAACAAAALAALAAGLLLWPAATAAGYPARGLASWAVWGLAPLFAVALVTALAAAVAARPAAPRTVRRTLLAAAAALALVLAVQRTGEMGSYYPTLPARAFYPRVPPLDALPAPSEEPWRIVAQDYALVPNQGTMFGLEDPRGYQAIFHLRFAELERLWAKPLPSWFLCVREVRRPFLSLVNVRYVLTSPEIDQPGWRRVAEGPGARLWENPRALPRAFVPRRVRLGVRSDLEVEEMSQETDFGERAWIVPPAGGAGDSLAGSGDLPREEPNGRGWVIARRRGLGFALTARMKQPGWAVITETAWTGWRARLDGREVPLGIGDHAFLALALPAGWHQAELFYRPRSFDLGLAVSAAALALIAALSLGRAVRRRRAAAGVETDRG